jgi:hypothetical protein
MENRGIEVELLIDSAPIKETLERIGICNEKTRSIYPSCYLINSEGKNYIIHFKNIFYLEDKPSTISNSDNVRQSTIAKMLEEWGMVKIVSDDNLVKLETYPKIFVLPHSKRSEYKIIHKYRTPKSN